MTRLPSLSSLLGTSLRQPSAHALLSSQLRSQDPGLSALDEESTLAAVGRTGLSGLGYVGGVLDKLFGGRALRGALAGKPRELLSIIPGSDTFDIPGLGHPLTDPNEATSGRQILEQYGALGQNTPGLDGGDVAGFAADVLLDPGSYLTFGGSALGRGGQVLKRAGVLDDALRSVRATQGLGPRMARLKTTVGDVLGGLSPEAKALTDEAASKMGINLAEHGAEAVGGNVGIGLPFARPSMTLGSERLSSGLDAIGNSLRFGKIPGLGFSPGVALAKGFKSDTLEATSAAAQREAELVLAPARRAAQEELKKLEAKGISKLYDEDMLNPQGTDAVRHAMEYPKSAPAGTAKGIGGDWHAVHEKDIAEIESLGLGVKRKLDSEMEAFASRMSVQTGSAYAKAKPLLQDIKGGTNTIRQMILDPDIQKAVAKKAAPSRIAKLLELKYGHLIPATIEKQMSNREFARISAEVAAAGGTYTKPTFNRYTALGKWLRTLSPEAMSEGLFGFHPIQDQVYRSAINKNLIAAGKSAYNLLGDSKNYVAKDGVPMAKVLESMKADKRVAYDIIGKPMGLKKSQFANLQIDPETAKSIGRWFSNKREPLGAVLKGIDWMTGLWKAGVTAAPGFHVRNFTSGQIRNWMDGSYSLSSLNGMHTVFRGGEWAGAKELPVIQQMVKSKGLPLDDASATNALRELMAVYVPFRESGPVLGAGLGEQGGKKLGDVLSRFPGGLSGSQPFSYRDTAKSAIPTSLASANPFSTKNFAPFQASNETAGLVEAMNRGAPFIEKLKQGFSPSEAGRSVEAAQLGYDAAKFTRFEQDVMKRLLPFYSFLKGATVDTARDIFTRPGGKQAMFVKGFARGSSPTEFLPPEVSAGAALPAGTLPGFSPTDAQGNPRYLTNLGLMNEQPLALMGGSPLESARFLAGSTNPLLKSALETVTGKSFFRQTPLGLKNLEDLDPLVGRTLSNLSGGDQPVAVPTAIERLAGASPASRLLSTIRTLSDPRKRGEYGGPGPIAALNVLTGLKFTDVSPQAKDAVLREEVRALLKDNRLVHSFENIYVSPEDMDKLTPEDRKLLALLRLQAQRKRQAKKAG